MQQRIFVPGKKLPDYPLGFRKINGSLKVFYNLIDLLGMLYNPNSYNMYGFVWQLINVPLSSRFPCWALRRPPAALRGQRSTKQSWMRWGGPRWTCRQSWRSCRHRWNDTTWVAHSTEKPPKLQFCSCKSAARSSTYTVLQSMLEL